MNYAPVYLDDLKKIQAAVPGLEKLKNTKVLITGAKGLICSAMADFLLVLNDTMDYQIQVYAAARNKEKVWERFGTYADREDFHFIPYDAAEPLAASENFTYLIHGASNANPAAYVKQPVETMLGNFIGMQNILNYARTHQAERVLYISSSEVYGKKAGNDPYREEEYEYVDILNARSCYPSSKRAAETLCAAYGKEYGVESVIVRPGHVYGPTMTEADNRASSQFPKDVLEGHDIVMKSLGSQIRSYCYVLDCVSAIFTVLLNGEAGNAYNISNPDSIATIREIAECFAETGGKKVVFELPTETEKQGYNMMENSSLASEKLEKLGWKGSFDLKTGVAHTLQCLSEKKQ